MPIAADRYDEFVDVLEKVCAAGLTQQMLTKTMYHD